MDKEREGRAEGQELGTLGEKEHHPAAYDALIYVQQLPLAKFVLYQEVFASCSLSGNRLAEICSGTLRRIAEGKGVGERYILGLAWEIKKMEDSDEKKNRPKRVVRKTARTS